MSNNSRRALPWELRTLSDPPARPGLKAKNPRSLLNQKIVASKYMPSTETINCTRREQTASLTRRWNYWVRFALDLQVRQLPLAGPRLKLCLRGLETRVFLLPTEWRHSLLVHS